MKLLQFVVHRVRLFWQLIRRNSTWMHSQLIVGDLDGHAIWLKYMFVYAEMQLRWKQELWAQILLFVVRSRVARLCGYVVGLSLHFIDTDSLWADSKFHLECLNFDCAPRGWHCDSREPHSAPTETCAIRIAYLSFVRKYGVQSSYVFWNCH